MMSLSGEVHAITARLESPPYDPAEVAELILAADALADLFDD